MKSLRFALILAVMLSFSSYGAAQILDDEAVADDVETSNALVEEKDDHEELFDEMFADKINNETKKSKPYNSLEKLAEDAVKNIEIKKAPKRKSYEEVKAITGKDLYTHPLIVETYLDNDIVKINTNKNSPGPSREWIDMAYTQQAKNKIRAFFNKIDKDENLKKGSEILQKELKKAKISSSEFFDNENITNILNELKLTDLNELYINIGNNKYTPKQIA